MDGPFCQALTIHTKQVPHCAHGRNSLPGKLINSSPSLELSNGRLFRRRVGPNLTVYVSILLCTELSRILSSWSLLELTMPVTMSFVFHFLRWAIFPLVIHFIHFFPIFDSNMDSTQARCHHSKTLCAKWYERIRSFQQTVCSMLTSYGRPVYSAIRRTKIPPFVSQQQRRFYLCVFSSRFRNDSLSSSNTKCYTSSLETCRSQVPYIVNRVTTCVQSFPCNHLLLSATLFFLSSTFAMGAYVDEGQAYDLYDMNSDYSVLESSAAVNAGSDRQPFGKEPGYKYSYNTQLPQKVMTEGVIICLLAITAFISLVVWLAKTNFKESQQRRMRREASLRDKTLILQSEDDIV